MEFGMTSMQTLLAGGLFLQAAAATVGSRRLAFVAAALPAGPRRRILLATILVVCGLATVAGMFVPFLVFFAACLALVCSLVILALSLRAHRHASAGLSLLLILLCIGVSVIQPLGLKVWALPKAADLPLAAAPARIVKTYDEGLWFEGIAAANDGTLYLSGNRNLDFSRADYFRHAQGEVIARRPDGTERIVFKTPVGSTAGVPAVAADGSIFLTSHSDSPGIWKISPGGQASKVAQLPHGAWPNGLDIGPDGLLYSPDSALGAVWRIDPRSGRSQKALSDPLLLARPYISLAPGANGLHFRGRDMYVTVSDKTTVLRYAMDEAGSFGIATVVAEGVPGDDFAIAPDGSLFITTHPYNTLVKVSPDGGRTIIAKEAQHIIGATDAAFGRTAQDQHTLYVVTDGGAFTGGPKTRGALVAIDPR